MRGQMDLTFRPHGGKRAGAGRKPKGHALARHQARPAHDRQHPVHVTIRVVGSATGLRGAVARRQQERIRRAPHRSLREQRPSLWEMRKALGASQSAMTTTSVAAAAVTLGGGGSGGDSG